MTDEDLAARMDLDGDGVPRPDDCDDDDPQVQAAAAVYTDADADGYGGATGEVSCVVAQGFSAVGGDCDDTNPLAFPGGDEVCDGADNDCNGTVDGSDASGQLTWYADADADGYGVTESAITACDQPESYSDVAGDCDDEDPTINPGVREVCDGRDEDCSGVADDPRWYEDADSDGYGSATSTTVACAQPDGFVTDDTDCNDARAEVNPGAPELCDDADIDEDCDGASDDDDTTATGKRAAYEDSDQDGHGNASVALDEACELAPGYAWASDDCDDTRADVNPDADDPCYDALDQDCDGWSDDDCDRDGADAGSGAGQDCNDDDADVSPLLTEVCGDDTDNDCDGVLAGSCAFAGEMSLADAPARVEGDATGNLYGIVTTGSFIGDASPDLAVTFGESSSSGVALISGPITADTDLSAGTIVLTEDTYEEMQGSQLVAADFDGDGVDDLLARGNGVTYTGLVGLFYGPLTGTRAMSDCDLCAEGADYEYLGYSLAAGGDINGDGFPDAALGSYGDDVYLLVGGDRADAAITASITGFDNPSVGLGGDMNGDGQDDLVVTEAGTSVRVFYEPSAQGSVSDADVVLTDTRVNNNQWSASIPGDTNADGYDDLIEIDCFYASGHPVAHLFLGPVASATDLRGAEATITLGTNYQSCAAAGAGDLNQDGKSDIVLGNQAEDGYAGVVYVLLSPLSGALAASDADGLLRGANAHDNAGMTVGPLGDINADGADDLYVGSTGVGDYGSIYLIFGGE